MARQLFVRNLAGATTVLQVAPEDMIADVKAALQAREGMPAEFQVLSCSGRLLCDDQPARCLPDQSTLHLTSRLRGGKPIKVKSITNPGHEVTIDIAPNASREEIKQKVAAVTGVPVEHLKVIMSNINQLMYADKRTNIKFSACGTADSVRLAVGK